eukprot:NODE_510_length_1660_cov_46.631906_g424_i0.p4 GENE.NODE_510_length_1660_cov_46.631906_g424_i0~~NODE_510_length_1660_cov_46.631906_g424_i0.p4  ORF type:complete len:71 (+),score=10.57 NODE_510_length_1660_cov_46.631906_g424_i0:254-466(+)
MGTTDWVPGVVGGLWWRMRVAHVGVAMTPKGAHHHIKRAMVTQTSAPGWGIFVCEIVHVLLPPPPAGGSA